MLSGNMASAPQVSTSMSSPILANQGYRYSTSLGITRGFNDSSNFTQFQMSLDPTPNLPVSPNHCIGTTSHTMQALCVDPSDPSLHILEQPSSSTRFRYQSEKGSHGALTASTSTQKKKTFPTVKLKNYFGEQPVTIRASLFTNEAEPRQHVHTLEGRDCEDGVCDIPVKDDFTALFQNLRIMFNCKKNTVDTIFHRKLKERGITSESYSDMISEMDKNALRSEAKAEAQCLNLYSVQIRFEAFYWDSTSQANVPICLPIYSNPIVHQKSLESGDLKIVRIDRYSGSCLGGDQIFLLCEKVNKKTIRIKFSEIQNGVPWEDYGHFSEVDVHHQVAIVFSTPPYHNVTIETPVEVFLQLFRKNDEHCSEPVKFTYTPAENMDEQQINRKRKKLNPYQDSKSYQSTPGEFRSSSDCSPYSIQLPQLSNEGNGGTDSSLSEGGHTSDSGHYSYLTTVSSAEGASPGTSNTASSTGVSPYSGTNFEYFFNDLQKPLPSGNDMELDVCDLEKALFGNEVFNLPDFVNSSESLNAIGLNETSQNPMFSSANVNLPQIMNQSLVPPRLQTDSASYDDIMEPQSAELSDRFGLLSLHSKTAAYINSLNFKHKSNSDDPQKMTELKTDHELRESENNDVSTQEKSWPLIQSFKFITDLVVKGGVIELLKNVRHFVPIQNEDGDNLLHLALLHQKESTILRILLQTIAGLPCNPINQLNKMKQTPLHLAAVTNNKAGIKLLLQHGGNANVPDRDGNTAAHLAVKYNHIACLRELLNMENYSSSNQQCIPDLNSLNYNGKAPLHIAVIAESKDSLEFLCSSGGNVNIIEGKSGRVALHLAIEHCPDAVKILLRQPSIKVDAQDYAGYTPLHLACSRKLLNCARELMAADANPLIEKFVCSPKDDADTEHNTGTTPFDLADGNPSLIAILAGEPIGENVKEACASPILETRFKEKLVSTSEHTEDLGRTTVKQTCDIKVDSGFISGSISLLDNETMNKVCELLDPPSEAYKELALYVGDDKNIAECFTSLVRSPTRAIIENFQSNGRDLPDLLGALELAGLNEAYHIVKRYSETR